MAFPEQRSFGPIARRNRRTAVVLAIVLIIMAIGVVYRAVGEYRSYRCSMRVAAAVSRLSDSLENPQPGQAAPLERLQRDPADLTPEERAIYRAATMVIAVSVISAFSEGRAVDPEAIRAEAVRAVVDTCEAAYLDPLRSLVRDRVIERVAATVPSIGVPGSPTITTPPIGPAPTTPGGTSGPDQGPVRFKSPSGNILCELRSGPYVRCDLLQNDWAEVPAKPADCDATWGRSVALDGRGARFECADEPRDAGHTVLPYGDTATLGTITCESQETGVTCFDAAGKGFWVSRDEVVLY